MYGLVLILHILGATIWTGGHLILALTVLPVALKAKAPEALLRFEPQYERIGLPALLVQVITGIWLAHNLVPDFSQWADLYNPVTRLILLKLSLLLITVLFAADARIRVFPKLTKHNLKSMSFHIIAVTILSVLFVVVGVSFRTGWLY